MDVFNILLTFKAGIAAFIKLYMFYQVLVKRHFY